MLLLQRGYELNTTHLYAVSNAQLSAVAQPHSRCKAGTGPLELDAVHKASADVSLQCSQGLAASAAASTDTSSSYSSSSSKSAAAAAAAAATCRRSVAQPEAGAAVAVSRGRASSSSSSTSSATSASSSDVVGSEVVLVVRAAAAAAAAGARDPVQHCCRGCIVPALMHPCASDDSGVSQN
jgi:hypothetical protein